MIRNTFWGVLLALLCLAPTAQGEEAEAITRDQKPRWQAKDLDGDGKISRQERSAARRHYLENAAEVDKKWEERADRNDDGTVAADELRRAQNKAYLENRSEVDKKWEERADVDDDGSVERRELIEAQKAAAEARQKAAEERAKAIADQREAAEERRDDREHRQAVQEMNRLKKKHAIIHKKATK